jgi:nitric oxide reductase activation protein
MTHILFNDKKIDSFLFMELSDLAKTLSKMSDLEVEYGYRSYYDPVNKKILLSHFWDNRTSEERVYGLKSEVFLRTIGNITYSDGKEMNIFLKKAAKTSLPSFAKQLFMLGEDLRLEEIIKRKRPGTKRAFMVRRAVYERDFESQFKVNILKSVHTDALFNFMYRLVTAQSLIEEIPFINEEINRAMAFIQTELTKFFETKSTRDVSKVCLSIIEVLEEILEADMLNTYFLLPELNYEARDNALTFDDLKRKDKLANCDVIEQEKEDDEDIHEEKMPMWHRETSETTKSFLQFDLEQGSQTDMLGEGVREGDAGDQAMGIVQGSAKKSTQNDYSQLEALENKPEAKEGGSENEYGKENKFAYPIFLTPDLVTAAHLTNYENNKAIVAPYQKKLKRMIQKTLEHKKIMPRSDLHFGRLNKKLIRLFTDENPRLFYKKHEPSTEIDAVFSLLVDCSASMFDKMEQTKLGITLFHEALKSVFVPHTIVGFWEDTNEATEIKQPNYFKTVVNFHSSLKRKSGPEIMQLEPEEDNRDGYAIRHLTKNLLKRSEKQKFLLVFSDGEPAAMGYEQNGIVDTHEAVLEARKQGIEVINVFLANGEIDEAQQKTIQNIYGKYSILVPVIEELPDVLFPLLKKLLHKSI